MNASARILPTRNEAWGFFGTMNEHAASAWPLAMAAVAQATGESPDAVRAFLDATPGRHFADEVHNGLHAGLALAAAIDAATQKWMGWRIGARTQRQYGIPRGLPYLTGFVIHCDSVADNE
ncbi:hypothetical protein [Paraburkholderia adhaesiva]|uniref:hypothetical protein n=1 Tax=Paraburkholderia adhaesiva TaxID=2883244 RepID=UPI001F323F26|nr:hypothetical protein [Paraburkholderia adhaesiva]